MAPNSRTSVKVSVRVRITLFSNISLHRISYFFQCLCSFNQQYFFVVIMAAICGNSFTRIRFRQTA